MFKLSDVRPRGSIRLYAPGKKLRHTCARVPTAVVCCQTSTSAQTRTRLELTLPTDDAKSAIRFAVVGEGRGHALEVASIRESSAAYNAGVRVGSRLRGISDPVRYSEVLQLGDRPSLRFVEDALFMRRLGTVELVFDVIEAPQPESSSASVTDTGDGTSIRGSSGITIAEQLATQYAQRATESKTDYLRLTVSMDSDDDSDSSLSAPEQVTSQPTDSDVQRRIQRRKSYLEQVGQRNDGPFFALVGSAFLLPPLVILAVAYSTGYLDKLYSTSLSP